MKIADLRRGYAAMNAGQWVGNIPLPLFEGVRLKVTRLWTPGMVALRETLLEESSDLSVEANERRVTDECMIQNCLQGWEGVDDEFSIDAARGLLADPAAGSALRTAIIWCASQVADQVRAQLEADAKNSVAP